MRTKSTLIMFATLIALQTFSQKEFTKWHFGTMAALDFMTSPPTSYSGSGLYTTAGCSSIADAAGNLLFYTNGKMVYNKNHTPMDNGSNLAGEAGGTQSGLIVKQPGNQNIYYIFSIGSQSTNAGHSVYYSVVDMSLAAGLGSVTILNVPLYAPALDKLAATTHCNGTDVWIVTLEFGTNTFKSHLLTSAGIITTAVNSQMTNTLSSSTGQMKFAPDGRKIGLAFYQGNFELYDFDPATGLVSNPFIIAPNIKNAYGCEFSPDGTKFYGSRHPASGEYIGAQLLQWDLCAGSQSAVAASQFSVSMTGTNTTSDWCGALQAGPDGKIYIATLYQQSLSVINNPNASATGCGYSPLSVPLQSGYVAHGLPSFVVYHSVKPVTAPFTWTANCQSVSFKAPATVSATSTCGGGAQSEVVSVKWLFGDTGAPGTSSSSIVNPLYAYSDAGTYTAKLILYYPCTSDTLVVPVTVTHTVPLVSVSGNTTFCKGEQTVLTASGAQTYSWNGIPGTGTMVVSPPASTSFTVTGSNASTVCPTTDNVIYLNVLPCTGVIENGISHVRVYPNPLGNRLTIETENGGELQIYTISGKRVTELSVSEGKQQIDTSAWPEGMYFLRINTVDGMRVIRICKSGQE